MKKLTFLFLVLVQSLCSFSQSDSVTNEILKFQEELNNEYKDPKTSPLKGKALKRFKGHEFFAIDLQYRVQGTLTITDNAGFFPMMTSSQVPKEYRVFGTIEFMLQGKTFQVPVYQSKKLMTTEEYKNYLFFPFTDLTTGKLSYGAGRYIDLQIPANGNTIIIDFNKAYNPLCAYSDGYSCPIVPVENQLDVEILAGVKFTDKKSNRKH